MHYGLPADGVDLKIVPYHYKGDVYVAYRKAGYSKKFKAEHESDILLHQAAKKFFDESGLKKLPTVKSLQAEYCKDYLMVLFLFIPANILQTLFSNLFVTAGKPGLGFGLSVLAGVANIILDYIFIVPCGLGIRGAALGTGFGYLIPTVAGLVYFARSKGTLSFTRPKLKWAVIGESCFNGSSEMVSQLATAVTTFLFNRTMMNLLGENGVAAITIIIYSQFLLNTLYIGYSMGIAPIIGFNYGNRNDVQQKRVFSISMRFIALASVLIFSISMFGGSYIVRLFADNTSEVHQIAANGFTIFSYSFLFCGRSACWRSASCYCPVFGE